jgi:hypothetical protein
MADDTIKKLGTVRAKDEGRDAIHIAVLTLQAKADFHVYGKLYVDKAGSPTPNETPSNVGIVDPFLLPGTKITKGSWFYVYLTPGSISGLVHVWTHPDFPDTPTEIPPDGALTPTGELRLAALQRIAAFCNNAGISLDSSELIELLDTGACRHFSFEGDSIYSGDEEISEEVPVAIIRDVETVIGRSVYESNEPLYFRCAC